MATGWWCKWTIRITAHVTFVTTMVMILVEVIQASSENNTTGPIVIICVLLLLSVIVIYMDLLRRPVQTKDDISPPPRAPEYSEVRTMSSSSPTPGDYINTTIFEPIMNFPFSLLNLGNTIGEGAFGKVVMAEAKDLLIPGVITHVAVKMLKNNHSDADARALTYEMEVMKSVGRHENIINLLGCSRDNYGKLLVIMDYALHGSLRVFLSKYNPTDNTSEEVLGQSDLVNIVWQVARGMEFLASKKCVHRDLATRNVLVSGDFTMKISDFGLARDIHERNYYRRIDDELVPVKWMAPESLMEMVYNSQTDVWSFGVLVWEIWSFGAHPYGNINIQILLEKLRQGYRLEKPPACPRYMYVLMNDCWNLEPNERPEFSKILELLTFFKRSFI